MSPTADNQTFARAAWLRALQRTAAIERDATGSLPLLIERLADVHEAAPAVTAVDASLSYRELAGCARHFARWGLVHDLRAGDVVALIAANGAGYLPAWLGLTRLGVAVALVNPQFSGDWLVHSLSLVNPRWVLVDAAAAPAVAACRARLPPALRVAALGRGSTLFESVIPALGLAPVDAVSAGERALPTLDATALILYTSGSTGLPKAVPVSHYRVMQWSHWFAGLLDTGPQDRMYNCLPMHHSVGGVVACGATLVGGGAVVIRERFSASTFWSDVRRERCTLFQYIGELCRYLLNSPPQAGESDHDLRIVCGNGLRPDVWEAFRSRFRIPRILEYYAATEANFSLYNCEGEPGAIGRIPPYLGLRQPVALLRMGEEGPGGTDWQQPRRNAAGFCERCAADEPGEAIALVPPGDGARGGRFEGYVDPAATRAKLLRDVFAAGDVWYRTGDLMRRDARGFFYFVDRLGDTFRWKGENVSTTQVMAALGEAPGVRDGVVYGVEVPGADGRAGMAALVVDANFDLDTFRRLTLERLPSFARPLFVRLLPALDVTSTLKPDKQALMREGFDPSRIADPLYVEDAGREAYVPLDAERHGRLTGA